MTDQFYDFRFKWTATTGIGIHPTKAWLSQLVNFKNAIWTRGLLRKTICHKITSKKIICIYQPLCTIRMWYKVNFLADFNGFEFRFSSCRLVAIPRLKSPVCSTIYLQEKIVGCSPFPFVLALYEIWTALFWIWTWFNISNNDN